MNTQRPNDTDLQQQLMAFGKALQDAYERAGVSKRQLAAAAKLDRAAVTLIEQGRRAPKFDKLLLLAQGAKTTPATLLEGIAPADGAAIESAPDGPLAASDDPAAGGREPLKRFGANLKWLRKHRRPSMSQEEVALEAGIDRSSPNGYETGRMCPPTLRTILKLAMGLGVSPGLLMEGVRLED